MPVVCSLAELLRAQAVKDNNWKCEVAAIKGKDYVFYLPACLPGECGQDSSVRPVPRRGGVGGRVGTEGERERRRGQDWQGAV